MIAEFGAVQVAVQGLLGVSALLIVRTLSKEDYALFAIANSMQATCNLLADVGIGVGLQAIGGRVCSDRYRFGQLLNTAFGLRRTFALIAIVFCLPAAAWMFLRNGAGWLQTLALCAAVTAGLVPLLKSSVFGVSPLLHGEYRRLQKIGLGNAALRLALLGSLAMARMNVFLAVMVGVLSNWIQAYMLRGWARDHADPAALANREDQRELLSISKKSLPNTLFFCFQGQVTILILTLFGNSMSIADITALGRVAALLTILSAIFANLFAPRFARCQDPTQLRRLYIILLNAAIVALLPLLFFAWFFPGPFLWLLGGKYQHLGRECAWVVLAGCLGQIGGVMWALNGSKAWIRFQARAFIPVILVAQIVAALFLNLRNFHDVLLFNVITAAAPLPIYIVDAWLGLKIGSREYAAIGKVRSAKG